MTHEPMKESLEKLVKDKILKIDTLDEWYLSNVFLATWEKDKYILRNCKKNVPWYEYPWDIYRTFLISHKMFQNAHSVNHVASFWVFEEGDEIYHAMEYVNGSVKDLSNYTEEDIKICACLLAKIHMLPVPEQYQNEGVYLRWLREVITNHETILSLYESEADQSSPYLKKILAASLSAYFSMTQEKTSRACVWLHWDFWHNNIMFEWLEAKLIDFSRIPFGEAWIDVWHFLINLEIEYLKTWEDKWKKYYNIFLETYVSITWDHEIVDFLQLNRLFVVWISTSNRISWFTGIDTQMKESLINLVL